MRVQERERSGERVWELKKDRVAERESERELMRVGVWDIQSLREFEPRETWSERARESQRFREFVCEREKVREHVMSLIS